MSLLAEFHGTCPECSGPIIPGERIESVEEQWQHVACGERPEGIPCTCAVCFEVQTAGVGL